jgi:spore germination cell wall hydrolase CwlJ-like protein
MAGEKLFRKALGILAGSAPSKVVTDPAERAANLAKAMSRSAIKNTETNEPLRLYHATTQPNLEALKAGGFDPTISGEATWLSPYADKQPAWHNTRGGDNYREGANVMPVYADIQTPLVLDTPEMIDWAQTAFAGGSREFPQYLLPEWRKALVDEGYDGIVYGGPKSKEYALHDLQIGQQPHRDEEILSLFPERQLKSAIGNSGEYNMEIPRLSEAQGGEVDAALHMLRQHRADGGFLSGPDYLSTGEAASPTNWGDPELASDFFKADRAARLAREVLAQEPARDVPLPPRRPPPVSEEAVAAAPLLARATLRVKEEEPAVPSVDEKFTARATSGPELTERDRDLIIRTIAAETSGKSPEESQAIAHVILNRIQSGKFGASPEAVLFAKNQFEPWSNPQGSNYPMRFAPTSARYGMGKTALEAALGGDDITRGALNFWGPKAQSALGRKPPPWAAKMPDYFDLGDTRFHRPRAEGGEVEDALAAVRRHYATDGYVSSTQRLRDVIASIDPEASRDQPVMDPEKMGEAWDRARRNYQNFPVQEGEAVARPLDLSARDVIGGAIAGEARAPGADFRRGVADLLVGSKGLPDSGTLGFGVADAPMLTGIPLTLADMAHDIGQGDYGTAAASAALPAALYARGPLGAAGRRAVEIAKEYAKPAAATAAGVAGLTAAPDEAEAANVSKALKIAGIGHNRPPGLIVTGSGLIAKDPDISKVILSKRDLSGGAKQGLLAKDIEYEIDPKGDLAPWRKFNPEDIYNSNGYVMAALGDRSRAGAMLNAINGTELTRPVNLQGGGEFKRSMEDPAVWASRESAVKNMYTGINKAVRDQNIPEDAPLYMSHTIMGYPSLDSTQMMAQSILRQIEPTRGRINPEAAEGFDRYVRRFHPEWPGILNPEDAERFLKTNEAGTRTSSILQALDKAEGQKGGLPSLGAARLAVMEPRLISADQLSSGFSISRLDPRLRGKDVAHETYTTPMFGEYMGGTEYQIPARLMFPDWYKSMSPTYLEKATGKIKETSPTMYQQGLLTKVPVQKATQEWLDNIMSHIEKNGRKWGYRYGGEAYA